MLPIVTMAVGGTAMLVGIACLSVAGTQKQEAESNDSLNREYGDYGVNLDTKKLNDQSASSTKTGTLLIAGGAVVAVGGADRGARAPTSKARSE